MSEVVEINDLDALQGYRLAWDDLSHKTPGASYFGTYHWFTTCWKYHQQSAPADDARLRVLIVSSENRVVGILPLVLRKLPTPLGSITKLTYPLDGWGSFYGPIGDSPAATLLAGFRHIADTSRDWDIIDLPWVNRTMHDRGRTKTALAQVGLEASEHEGETAAMIELNADWPTYWASRTSKWRNNVRRCEKKLRAQGPIEFVRYRPAGSARDDDDPRWDLYDDCIHVAEKSWQAGSHTGTTLIHEEIRDYLRVAHQTAVDAGSLDMVLLYLSGQPVAFAYNYHFDSYVFGLRMGFDRERSAQGAGTALLRFALEDGCERGDRVVDLGLGYLDAKRHWWTDLVPSYRYTHTPRYAPRAQAYRVGRWLNWQLKRRQAQGAKET